MFEPKRSEIPAERRNKHVPRRVSLALTCAIFAAVLGGLETDKAVAAEKRPALKAGQPYQEVLKLWGAPVEREERESARLDVWHYPFGKVRFHEGRVVKWTFNNLSPAQVEMEDSFRQPEPARRADSKTADEDPLLVEEILEEIMKEAPQGEDKAPPGSLPPPPPPPPGMIMPNQPPVTTP
jgi:hypothetical protein